MSMILDGSNGVTFNDSSLQGSAASPYVLKNRIINGAMVIDQRNAGASGSGGGYTVDRWAYFQTQSSKVTWQQNAGSVTPPAGFSNYFGFTSSSSYSVAASDIFMFRQFIEGFNWADLAWGTANAQTVTLSFWVRSSLTGTFGGSILNTNETRAYPFSYTISNANTWTKISITIAGDTNSGWIAGTNPSTNGVGAEIAFSLGGGSTYSGTAGAWVSSAIFTTTGATSIVGTSGATWYITGVQLEIGTSATPFERRLYNQELANCQRYYFKSTPGGTFGSFIWQGNTTNTIGYASTAPLPVIMRAQPTMTSTYVTGSGFSSTLSNIDSSPSSVMVQGIANATNTGQYFAYNFTASAEL